MDQCRGVSKNLMKCVLNPIVSKINFFDFVNCIAVCDILQPAQTEFS